MSAQIPNVAPLRGAAATAIPWRSKGELHVTVIAKASFAFAPDAEMPRVEPQAILRAEVHLADNPAKSVRFTSDLAPFRGRVDVLFTGSAHAPGGGAARSLPVRLALVRGNETILDKRLLIQDSGGFQRMPVTYERALRGPTGLENPLGVAESPTIIDPARPDRPAGFGPIARAWPVRKRLLGSTPLKALDSALLDIPDGFDWTYFQAAPADQRVDVLRGDEWIVLEGLHPTQSPLRTRLPGVRGVARVHGLAAFGVPDGQALELAADTLRIDGDEQRCTLVFRRSFPITSEAALAALQVVAGVEIAGEALSSEDWPDPRALGAEPPSAAPDDQTSPGATLRLDEDTPASPRPRRESLASTLAIPPDLADAPPQKPALPFEAAPSGNAPSPYAVASSPRERSPHVPTGTLALPPEPAGSLESAPLSAPAAEAPADVSPWAKHQGPLVAEPDGVDAARFFHDPHRPPPAEPTEPSLPELPAPLPDGRELSVERCAAVAAELSEQRSSRAKVLAAHGLSEARFAESERRWSSAIEQELDKGERALRDAYDEAYVAAWEKIRGRLTPAAYAGLTVAAESGELPSALRAASMRRAVWMRIQRAYTKRLKSEPELAAAVEQALSAARSPSA